MKKAMSLGDTERCDTLATAAQNGLLEIMIGSSNFCKILDENNFGDYPVFAQCSLSVRSVFASGRTAFFRTHLRTHFHVGISI